MGLILILLTGLAWGGIGIVLGYVSKRKFDVFTFITAATVLSSLGAWIFLANWSSIIAGECKETPNLLLVLTFAGVAGGLGMLYLQKSMTGGAAAWTVGQSAMVLPFLAGTFFFEESMRLTGGVGVAIIIFSLVSFAKGSSDSTADSKGEVPWLRFALIAFVLLGIQQTLSSVPSSWEGWSDSGGLRVPLVLTAGGVPLFILAVLKRKKPNREIIGLSISYSILVIVGQFLLFTAMDQLRLEKQLSLAFPIAIGTCIIIVALWDILVWKRRPGRMTIIGLILGLAGVVLVAL